MLSKMLNLKPEERFLKIIERTAHFMQVNYIIDEGFKNRQSIHNKFMWESSKKQRKMYSKNQDDNFIFIFS